MRDNNGRFIKGISGNPNTQFKKGQKKSEETKKRMSESHKNVKRPYISKEKNYLWKGTTSINEYIRKSLEYKIWREAVFKRDNYTCIWCGKKGIKLHADHIKPFALFPELRFAIDNGRTLCISCHKKTDTYGSKSFKNK